MDKLKTIISLLKMRGDVRVEVSQLPAGVFFSKEVEVFIAPQRVSYGVDGIPKCFLIELAKLVKALGMDIDLKWSRGFVIKNHIAFTRKLVAIDGDALRMWVTIYPSREIAQRCLSGPYRYAFPEDWLCEGFWRMFVRSWILDPVEFLISYPLLVGVGVFLTRAFI